MGGKSSRFGSDKGLFPYKGKPLIIHELEVINNFNHEIYLVANSKQQIRNYKKILGFHVEIHFIKDDSKYLHKSKERTPLLGLYSGFKFLSRLKYNKVFVLSCDLPKINIDVVKNFIDISKKHECIIPKWKNNYIEPLFAIYPVKKAYHKAKENLNNGIFKLAKLIDKSWDVCFISIENYIKRWDPFLETFININKISDLELLGKEF
ncbi:MAG: molybdenum cofactor guanylyltransferase [Promethearchaeota archaeon]